MNSAYMQLQLIAATITANEQCIPEHREIMTSSGGPVAFHELLTQEIETQTRRRVNPLTWRRIAPELVESDAEAWALIAVSNIREVIDDVTLILGEMWIINAERSARAEFSQSASAAYAKKMRKTTKEECGLALHDARDRLLVYAHKYYAGSLIGMTVDTLLQGPLAFADVVAAARLMKVPVKITFSN